MSVFAVVLNEENHDVAERIKSEYPDSFYRLTGTFFLVKSNAIPEAVATSVGIKGDRRIETARGVVFKLNRSYSGFTARSLWDWLRQAEELE